MPFTPTGEFRERITLQNPGGYIPDGEGGYTEGWTDLDPDGYAKIESATAASLERVAAGTVLSTASHIVRTPYRPGVTTKSRLLFKGRTFSITNAQNVDERGIELVLVCEEIVE